MFNPTTLVAEALGRHLADTYDRRFGGREPEYGRILESAGKLVIDYEYTAVAPLESLTMNQRITDRYYASFADLAA